LPPSRRRGSASGVPREAAAASVGHPQGKRDASNLLESRQEEKFVHHFRRHRGVRQVDQARLLAEHLRGSGFPVRETREPGGSPIGRELRGILLTEGRVLSSRAELLLYAAERAEHVDRCSSPRCGGRLGRLRPVRRRHPSLPGLRARPAAPGGRGGARHCHRGLEPDLTLYLRVPVEKAIARARGRNCETGTDEGRFEAEPLEFTAGSRQATRPSPRNSPRG